MSAAAWSAGRLVAAARGTLVAGDPGTLVRGSVSTDTRLLAPGDVFCALPGEHVDGGLHVAEALRGGAAGVIAAARHLDGLALPPGAFAIAVAEPRAALRTVAIARRAALPYCEAIAITGTAGKTTTTDVLATLLRPQLRTQATRHGFNTVQGVAATIAGAPPDAQALVVEVGLRYPGGMTISAALLRPTTTLVTNVASDHLATVGGTLGHVAREKARLIAALPPGGTCVVPAGEPLLAPHLRDDVRTVTHGPGGDVALARFAGGVAEIDCAGTPVRLELAFTQPHRLRNVVAAVAAAWAIGLAPPDGPLDVTFSPYRWQPAGLGELELLLDCAKTGPLALATALEEFAAEPAAARRFAVLGELPELGEESDRFHHEAGALAARLGFDALIVVGEQARAYLPGFGGASYCVETPEEARTLLTRIGRRGDRVLVKGKSVAALQRIVPA